MKKVLKKFNRTLSIMLAAAMVLTMVPQTAMPVLAAETQDVTDPSETPDTTPATDENEGSADVVEAKNPGNQEDSNTTEGENDESTEGETTPVTDGENNSDENQGQEGTPDVEEEPIETPEKEKPAEETGEDSSVLDADLMDADVKDEIAAPVITVKNHDRKVTNLDQALPNRDGITFEIEAAEGTTFRYTTGETKPTKDTGDVYSGPVPVTAPDPSAECSVKINAIAVVTPESGEAQVSKVTTVEVKFAASKTISLSDESDDEYKSEARVTINEIALTQAAPYTIADPEQRLYLNVAPENEDTLFEVMYRYPEDDESVWTSAYKDEDKGYLIPGNENLQVKVVNMRKITLKWLGEANWRSVEMSATAVRSNSNYRGNLIVFGDRLKGPYEGKIYAPKDTEVWLTVRPIAGQNIQLKVALAEGAKDPEDQTIDAKGVANFLVAENITADYTLTIQGIGSYQRAVLRDKKVYDDEGYWKEVAPDKNKNYNVVPGGEYELGAQIAGGDGFNIGSVAVTEKGELSDVITVTTGVNGVMNLTVKNEASGKTLSVEIRDAQGTAVDTITLKVTPVIEKVTIAGAKNEQGKLKLKQQIGTEVKYALTPDNKAGVGELFAYIKGSDDNTQLADNEYVEKAEIEDGRLVVKTKANIKEKTGAAVIVIGNRTTAKNVAEVALDTLAPAWVTASPTLKQVSATETSLTVDIVAPKGAVLYDDMNENYDTSVAYYYKVDVKKKNGTNVTSKYVHATEQTKRFTFNLSEQGKADYEMTAQLFLCVGYWDTEQNENAKPAGEIIAESKVSAVLKHATRAPYYADKITMKKEKAASNLYTGQQYVHVATVDFGKNASYNSGADVEIYDIPEGLSVRDRDYNDVYGYEERPAVLADDLKVIVSADESMKPGKYTIKARTTYYKDADNAASSIVQATYSLPVTVVQGIYDIEATAPAKIYTSGKGATAKIAVAYNTYGIQPKTKKVTYDLVKGEYSDEIKTVPGITVNNGTIKVDKSYQVKNTQYDPDANKYWIRVKAADYKDNYHEAYVSFEVTGTAVRLGDVAIVKNLGYDSGAGEYRYEDWTPKSDGEEIAINKLQGLKAVVVKPNRKPVHGIYTESDFMDPTLYTLTIPKGIKSDGNVLYPEKLGKNLVIKATSLDGGDKKSTKKFTIGYDDSVPENEVKVTYASSLDGSYYGKKDFLEKGKEVTLNDDMPAGTLIKLAVTDKDKYELAGSVYDYTLSTKNAKVVKKYDGGLSLDVIVTKNPATITLKKGRDVVGTYDIRIPNLDVKALSDAAPKVSLKKGVKIYPGIGDQELAFTMNKAVEGARYVRVCRQDDEDDTNYLFEAIINNDDNDNDKVILNAIAKEFSFKLNTIMDENYEPTELKRGASLAFVFLDRDGKVLTKTTNAIKIKTTALKKSYKLNAKYTLSTKDAFSAPFTGKGTGVDNVTYRKLYNANFRGSVNQFREGFKLAGDRIELRIDEATGKAIAEGWTNKNNFIGFVEYTVNYVDGDTEEFVSKIQVDLKKTDRKGLVPTAKKYAASAVSVLNPGVSGTTEGVSYVTTGKINADIRAAKIVYSTKSGRDTIYSLENADSPVQVKKVSGNEITLTIRGAAAKTQSYKGKIYVLPLDGMYAYDNNYKNWDVGEWQEYGVELNYNVSLKAANSTGKIKSPAKSVSFLNVEPEKLAVDGRGKMYYYAELPYTAGIFAQIDDKKTAEGAERTELKSKQPTKDLVAFDDVKGLFKVRKVSNKNALGLYIDAEAFKAMVNGDKKWSGVTFPKMEMTVHFVGELRDSKTNKFTAAPPETISISLTMPNPWNIMSSNEEKLARIIRIINGGNVKIAGIAYSSYDAAERKVAVTANDPTVSIQTAVNDAKDDMVTELLKDPDFKRWVGQLASIKVGTDLNSSGSVSGGRKIDNTGDDRAFLTTVVDTYMTRLVEELEKKGNQNPIWNDLKDETIALEITATPKADVPGAKEQTERCTVEFSVDREAGDDLDSAITRTIGKLNDGPVINSIWGEYNPNDRVITVHGDDPEMDFIDSKNQSRDKTVQILLSELGEYMDRVEEIEFSHQYAINGRDCITVRKNGRETSEQYIADLVDKWTDKLVEKLNDGYDGEGNPNAYGRLRGKELTVKAKFIDETVTTYTIRFDCEERLTGLNAAIDNAVNRLNEAAAIPGVAYVSYDASEKAIVITGNDRDQDIMDSKKEGRDSTVQILLDEMEEYMDEVSEVTFTTQEGDYITVKRENRESTEDYISDLVDKWTQKLADKLTSEGKPVTYGSLGGKTLQVEVKYHNTQRPKGTYTISFTIQ